MELMRDPEPLKPEECSGVCVFAEQRRGGPAAVALEVLGEGRRLADTLGQELHAVAFGESIGDLAEELRHYGIDKIHAIDAPVFANFQAEAYAVALAALVREIKPSILLCGQTNISRSFMGDVAQRLGAGLTAGCTALEIDPASGNLVQTRSAFGATVFASVVADSRRPQIAIARPRTLESAERRPEPAGEVIHHAVPDEALSPRVRFLESISEGDGSVDLTEAEVIVSGGRGIGGPEAFEMLRELADAVGGVVGASRAAVDAGWISYSHQVGQTGKSVKPRIYIACGISGAIQHLVGMRSSDTIIAINRDAEVPIFKAATYGLVGDVKQIVPALTRRFRQG